MIIRALTNFRYRGDPVRPGNVIEVDDLFGHNMVALGGAVEMASEAPVAAFDGEPSVNTSKDAETPDAPLQAKAAAFPDDEREFSIKMSINELRQAMKAHGYAVKVGMTKQEMVETLNGDVLPDIDAMDVVDE